MVLVVMNNKKIVSMGRHYVAIETQPLARVTSAM